MAEKIDAIRGLLAQLRQANDALNRIIGETFTPKQVNQFVNTTCVQLENFLNNIAVATGTHGDTTKRLSKVLV